MLCQSYTSHEGLSELCTKGKRREGCDFTSWVKILQQSWSAVNASLLESLVLTLDLNARPHLRRVVSYSRTAYLHTFGAGSSFLSAIPFAPQQLVDYNFVSANF